MGISFYTYGQSYNYYYGNLHSHTAYSDGNQDSSTTLINSPGKSFAYAKSSYHMDFLGIAEHNHFSSSNNPGMHVADYSKGLTQADTANNDGSFVAMYGMEWGTISAGGHVVIYEIPDLIGWETLSAPEPVGPNYTVYCYKTDYSRLWKVIDSAAYPKAFATLAHPQSGDYNDLLGTLSYSTQADSAITGIAIRSGSATSSTTTYTDAAPTLYETRFKQALAKGYHLGPTMDQDNHYTNFGRNNKIRTVVLAASLTRDNIIDAYRNMRFYASDDWNAQVSFTVNSYYMGSQITTYQNSSISVSLTDPDAESTSKIEIYYGVPGSGTTATLLTSNTNNNTLSYTHPTTINDQYYYYAKITQADGDIIWTSPVWIIRSDYLLASADLFFTARQLDKSSALLKWSSADNSTEKFVIEKSLGRDNFMEIGKINANNLFSLSNEYSFTDNNLVKGTQFYRLKLVDKNGDVSFSQIEAITVNQSPLQIITVSPNPAHNILSLLFNADNSGVMNCKIFSEEGRLQMIIPVTYINGRNQLTANIGSLAKGTYFLVMEKPGERLTQVTFVKQ